MNWQFAKDTQSQNAYKKYSPSQQSEKRTIEPSDTIPKIFFYNSKCFWQRFRKTFSHISLKNINSGLHWRYSGSEYACQCRRHGFNPWSSKIPHVMERLSPHAKTTEPAPRVLKLRLLKPMRLEPVLHDKRSHGNEMSTHRKWRVALALHN